MLTGAAVGVEELQVQANCGDAYSGAGDWNINSTLTCSNEEISVNGNLNILDNSEKVVSSFSSQTGAAYDLRGNSSAIAAAIPDQDSATPTQYTDDWDSNTTRVFKISMNKTENKLIIYTALNTTDAYVIDVDGNLSSGVSGIGGGLDGTEIVITRTGANCWNLSDPAFFTALNSNGGICNNAFDAGIITSTTVYYNSSNNFTETILVIDGGWRNKYVALTENDFSTVTWTTFKNSSVNTSGVGNVTFQNITLTILNNKNITINANTEFIFNYSKMVFSSSDNSSRLNLNSGAITKILNSNLTTDSNSRFKIKINANSFCKFSCFKRRKVCSLFFRFA